MASALDPNMLAMMGLGILNYNQPRPYNMGPPTLGGALGAGGTNAFNYMMTNKPSYKYQTVNNRLVRINEKTGEYEVVQDFSTPKKEYKEYGPDKDVYSITDGQLSESPVLDFDSPNKPRESRTRNDGGIEVTEEWDGKEWVEISRGSRWKPNEDNWKDNFMLSGGRIYKKGEDGDPVDITPKESTEWSDPYFDDTGNLVQKNTMTNKISVLARNEDTASMKMQIQKYNDDIDAARDAIRVAGIDLDKLSAGDLSEREKFSKKTFMNPALNQQLKTALRKKLSSPSSDSDDNDPLGIRPE